MLMVTPARILIARDPVDFRKSIDGLAAVCEVTLKERPLDGTLFLFTNRARDSVKGLAWTHGGFLLFYKRLERGRVRWLVGDDDRCCNTGAELAALLEGIDLTGAKRLHRWNPAIGLVGQACPG